MKILTCVLLFCPVTLSLLKFHQLHAQHDSCLVRTVQDFCFCKMHELSAEQTVGEGKYHRSQVDSQARLVNTVTALHTTCRRKHTTKNKHFISNDVVPCGPSAKKKKNNIAYIGKLVASTFSSPLSLSGNVSFGLSLVSCINSLKLQQ